MVQLPADLGRASNLLICKAAAPRQQGARAQPAVWLHGCARRCPGPRCQSHPRGELPGSRCCLASQKENRCVRSVENEVAARGYVNDRVTLALATCPRKRGGLRPARTREGLLLTHLRKRQVATPPPPPPPTPRPPPPPPPPAPPRAPPRKVTRCRGDSNSTRAQPVSLFLHLLGDFTDVLPSTSSFPTFMLFSTFWP